MEEALIDHITGCPIESQTLETIQQAIDELGAAYRRALEIRDKLKEEIPHSGYENPKGCS